MNISPLIHFLFLCRLATGDVVEGEHVIDKAQGGRTTLGRGMKPW